MNIVILILIAIEVRKLAQVLHICFVWDDFNKVLLSYG